MISDIFRGYSDVQSIFSTANIRRRVSDFWLVKFSPPSKIDLNAPLTHFNFNRVILLPDMLKSNTAQFQTFSLISRRLFHFAMPSVCSQNSFTCFYEMLIYSLLGVFLLVRFLFSFGVFGRIFLVFLTVRMTMGLPFRAIIAACHLFHPQSNHQTQQE